MKKIFVITTHSSKKYCKNGNFYLEQCLDSLFEIKPDKIIIVDNESETRPELSEYAKIYNIDYLYINDQKKRGLTGAWNVGIEHASKFGPGLICNTNNDVAFDLTYLNLYSHIINDKNHENTIYGAKTNNPGWQTAQHMFNPHAYILDGKKSNVLNGFCLFFTTNFYKKYNENGLLFTNEKENPWGGQESVMTKLVETKNIQIKVLNNCFVYHKKEASWRKVVTDV